MAYIRKLPSGKWQATVRGPDGKRHTKVDKLKVVVKEWATDEENKIAQGRWRDPRAGRITVADWSEKWFAARVVEAETRRGDRGVLNNHILPTFAGYSLNVINPLDVQTWVRQLQKEGAGPHVIRRAYNLFATMLGDAVTAGILAETPCRKIDIPPTPPKLPAWFTRAEVDRIRAELDDPTVPVKPGGRRPTYRGHSVMVELMVCVGLRWGEAAALCGAERPDGNPVDWLRGRAKIVGTLDANGRWKSYPKSRKSRREVPLPRHVLDEMGQLLAGRDRAGYLFVTNRGAKTLSGANWRVVWYAAIDRANAKIERENRGVPEDGRVRPVQRLDPHDCRHTAASWLVQDGVPLYKVQALLGHESAQTTQRYAHLAPDAHEDVENAWKNILTHVRRTNPAVGGETSG